MRIETIGNATLYLGDCREVFAGCISRGCFSPVACEGFGFCRERNISAIITDPPYGLGNKLCGGSWGSDAGGFSWDMQFPDFLGEMLLPTVMPTIIWGGNYGKFPPSRCWLVWHKTDAPPSMSPVELAWTNLDMNSAICRYPIYATREAEGYGFHPTQKPEALMRWCVDKTNSRIVIDPFMGSGTTGVAAIKAGRKFIGCEIDAQFFETACHRIEKADRQKDLLTVSKEDAVAAAIPELPL